ncbi:hypothetical protein [Actinosynnema sp. NPDC020468]|uniref:hypothetical protein n=1 Tax=Actinosynnema sp. NPDC020468 TaxID=3154488 RepID=UPI0033C9CD4D
MRAGPVQDFATELREFHLACGKPSYPRLRDLASRCGAPLSPASISEVLNAKRLPKLEFVLAFVDAALRHVGADEGRRETEARRWRARWRQAHHVPAPRDFDTQLDRVTSARDARGRRWVSARHGCFALYDQDGEVVHIGQADDTLAAALRDHLLGARADVAEVELWPAWWLADTDPARAAAALDRLERAVYQRIMGVPDVDLPPSTRVRVDHADVDVRIARYAEAVARLAFEVTENPADPALRRALAARAAHLSGLASARALDDR